MINTDGDPKNPGEAFSYADGDFYDTGNLHADHLQPADSILFRQLEMIMAMNIDQLFKQKMMAHPESGNFFKEANGTVFGTQYFFLVYFNCIDNLWLISASANTGISGKNNQDPIEWLASHDYFGKDFFNAHAAPLNKDKILYEIIPTNLGKPLILAEASKIWFKKQYAKSMSASNYIGNQITGPLQEKAKDLFERGANRDDDRIAFMVRVKLAEMILDLSSKSSHSEKDSNPELENTMRLEEKKSNSSDDIQSDVQEANMQTDSASSSGGETLDKKTMDKLGTALMGEKLALQKILKKAKGNVFGNKNKGPGNHK